MTYDGLLERFSMSPDQAMVFVHSTSPVYMVGGFLGAAAGVHDERMLAEAFRSGGGIDWGDHCDCLFCGTERFFRPSYETNLVQIWLPSLEGVIDKLEAGALVADTGCGHGISTLVLARAFPQSRFVGFNYHAPSIARAEALAKEYGLSNVRFEVGTAQEFPVMDNELYDMVATFDALHDMGDPIGAATRALANLKSDGTWMVVEPAAADQLEDKLNPVSRVFYAMSTALCVPSAMSQEGGEALGAQAGPAEIRRVVTAGGFSRSRVAIRTPFNLVIEARP